MRIETIGDAMLIHADCREWLASLPECFRADALVTDPPYGVSLTGKAGHYRNEPSFKRTDTYLSYEDTPENFDGIVVPALVATLERVLCGAVFMADKSIFKLPQGHIGGIFMPNGCGMTAWGFQNFMHVIFYGKCPYLAASKGSRPNGKYGLYGNDSNGVDHPCAKPIAAMQWAVDRVSFEGQTIIDPFMGSGTTGVACADTGRKFIGIEIEQRYFDLACKRIEIAYAQGRLFA